MFLPNGLAIELGGTAMQADQRDDTPAAAEPLPARAERKATNWIALIRTLEGVEIPCNVKDVSSSGARLGVPAHYALPQTFMLKVVGRDFVCRVRLAWRKGDYVGVQIEQIGKLAPAPAVTADTREEPPKPDASGYAAIGRRRSRVSSF